MSKRPAVLLTLLEENPALASTLGEELSRLGADCRAHFWTHGQDVQALAPLLAEVCQPDHGAWLIAGEARTFARPDMLRGLALAALAARATRQQTGGTALPILLAPSGGDLPSLPTPLQDADIVVRGIGAKTIARLFTPGTAGTPPYRLALHARPGLGLWLECGPSHEPWEGVLLGASGCAPDAHGVGPAGVIPQRCTLHHPLRGCGSPRGEGNLPPGAQAITFLRRKVISSGWTACPMPWRSVRCPARTRRNSSCFRSARSRRHEPASHAVHAARRMRPAGSRVGPPSSRGPAGPMCRPCS